MYSRILFIYAYLFESILKVQKLARNLDAVLSKNGVSIFAFSVLEAKQPRSMMHDLTFPQMVVFTTAYNYKTSYYQE